MKNKMWYRNSLEYKIKMWFYRLTFQDVKKWCMIFGEYTLEIIMTCIGLLILLFIPAFFH